MDNISNLRYSYVQWLVVLPWDKSISGSTWRINIMDKEEQDIVIEIENMHGDPEDPVETVPTIEDIHEDFEELIETGPSSEETVFDLEEIRKSKGYTLNDLSSLTKISPRILMAIEQQNFALLPDPFYARSFIKMYMKVLNIEGEKILSLYDQYLNRVEANKERKYPTVVQGTVKSHRLGFWMLAMVTAVLLAALVGYFFVY